MRKQVTISLEFDVEFPVDADNDAEARLIAEEMTLTDYMEWAVMASYNMNILGVRDDE